MGTFIPARFNPDTVDTATLREALIDDDIENMDSETLYDIVNDTWEQIEPFVRSHLARRWSDNGEVWMEARDRGLLDPDFDPNN